MANFGFYSDDCITQAFRDYDSIGAIVEALIVGGRLRFLLLIDRSKMREDKPAKNIRERWQLVSADDNQRYCKTFRSKAEALRKLDSLINGRFRL